MKKALWLTVAIMALLAVTAVPAMAGGGKHHKQWSGTRFGLAGEVMAMDANARTMTVRVHACSCPGNDCVGEELLVSTDGDTAFLRCDHPRCQSITFEDIEVGACVSVNGIMLADEGADAFLAKRIMVDIQHCARH